MLLESLLSLSSPLFPDHFHSISFQLYEYGRSGNPTRDVLEQCLASLDNGKYGLTFSSGLGATTIITQLLDAGDHIISSDDVYGGTNRLFSKIVSRQGIAVDFVDGSNAENVRKALKPNTKVISNEIVFQQKKK